MPPNSKLPAFSSCDGGSPSLNILVFAWAWTRTPLTGSWCPTNELWRLYNIHTLCQNAHIHVLADFFQYFWRIFCILRFFVNNLIGQGIFHGDQDFLSLNCPQCKKKCSAWHKNTNILLFFYKIVILIFMLENLIIW